MTTNGLYYETGGVCFRICGAGAGRIPDGFTQFAATPGAQPQFTVQLEDGTAPLPGKARLLWQIETDGYASRFSRTDNGYLLTACSPQGNELWLTAAGAGHGCRIYGSPAPDLLRFALWIGCGLGMLTAGVVAVHASAITYGGRAVLFLGESGTGKSTHSRLWYSHIPGTTLLNDDSPLLGLPGGSPRIYGSPWSGKTPCYRNESFPLAAVVRLSQAPTNHIRRLPAAEAVAALYPSLPPAFTADPQLSATVCDLLPAILAAIPVFHLACLPDPAAAHLSFHTIFG